jgi:hypothetical protein
VARNVRPPTSQHQKNPYYGWKIDKLNQLLLELAKVSAAGRKVKAAGYIDTKRYAEFVKQNPNAPLNENPNEGSIWQFYESLLPAIWKAWPTLSGPISFFFDQTENADWRNAIDRIHFSYQKKVDSRVKELTFADKKIAPHYPLQAADMLAYRLRQIGAKFCHYDDDIPDQLPEFDRILFGNEYDEFKQLFPNPMQL